MLRIAIQLLSFVLLVSPTLADDWVVSRTRGTVEHQSSGKWVALERGMAILDGAAVRTGSDGRVGLARGAETIEMDPGTQIVLHEGAGRITSIEQTSGVLIADVEKRNVQHFSVQTPFAAAVVKGTRFRVAVGRSSAQVVVERGTVQVQDTLNDLVVDVVRGQQAEVGGSQPLEVSGPGSVAVFTFEGERVVNGTADVPADNQGEPLDQGSNTNTNTGTNGNGNEDSGGNGNSNSGNSNSNGHSGNGNSGNGSSGNGNSNNGDSSNGHGKGGGNGNSSNGNSGNGNSGNGNGNSGNSTSGGNGNSGNGNANGNSGNSDSGNSGNGNSANGNGGGNGNGNSGTGNSGNGNSGNSSGNGGGNGNGNSDSGVGNGNGNSNNGNGNGNGNGGGDKPDKPEKDDKSDKPDKPEKGDKPDKPEK